MMDKTESAQRFEKSQNSESGLYKLPKLPPQGMRFQQQSQWHRPMVRNIVKPH
jgi:hypothetical protein